MLGFEVSWDLKLTRGDTCGAEVSTLVIFIILKIIELSDPNKTDHHRSRLKEVWNVMCNDAQPA